MRIEDGVNATLGFREQMVNFWASFKDHKQHVTLGAFLHEIKKHHLYRQWGHKSFQWYCRNELHLVPVRFENIYVANYVRLAKLGVSAEEMRSLERQFSRQVLSGAAKYAKTKDELLKLCKNPRSRAENRRNLHKRRIGPFKTPAFDLLMLSYGKISGKFGCTRDEAPLVSAILGLCITYKRGIHLQRTVKRLCNMANLSDEVRGEIMGVLE
jgi:hypothetical protein